jgi:hypothetical protein
VSATEGGIVIRRLAGFAAAGLVLAALCAPTAATAAPAAAPHAAPPAPHSASAAATPAAAHAGECVADAADTPSAWSGGEAAALRSSGVRADAGRPLPFETGVVGSAAGEAGPVIVRTHVHVLRSPRGPVVTRARIRAQLRILNGAFVGRQSQHAAGSPFRFRLVDVTRAVNRAWDHMDRMSLAERRAKGALHRGDADDLNLYVVARSADVLGWATSPQSYGESPRLDGVVVSRTTLPGGSRGRYSAGDAAVHETGHWLGLLHTFAGKCGSAGDRVLDTAAEARASYACAVGRDTCSSPGSDPVRNFMDYSYDACMNHFTPGQVDRMTGMWQRFRSGGGSA